MGASIDMPRYFFQAELVAFRQSWKGEHLQCCCSFSTQNCCRKCFFSFFAHYWSIVSSISELKCSINCSVFQYLTEFQSMLWIFFIELLVSLHLVVLRMTRGSSLSLSFIAAVPLRRACISQLPVKTSTSVFFFLKTGKCSQWRYSWSKYMIYSDTLPPSACP